MSLFGYSDPPGKPIRTLRRLSHSTVVKTNYLSRVAEIEMLDEDKAEAIRQGFELGYAEGQAKAAGEAFAARGEAKEKAHTAFAALASAVCSVQEAENALRAEINTTVPRMVFALLEQLLARESELATNPGREAIVRAIGLDEGIQPVVIRMNPVDIETIGEVADISLGRDICIVADSFVEPGGALAEIGRSTVDAQLGSALDRVKQVLLGQGATGGAE